MPATTTASAIANTLKRVLATPSKAPAGTSNSRKSVNKELRQLALLAELSDQSFSTSDDETSPSSTSNTLTLEEDERATTTFTSTEDDADDNDDDEKHASFLQEINPNNKLKRNSGSSHGRRSARRMMLPSSERDVPSGDNSTRRRSRRRSITALNTPTITSTTTTTATATTTDAKDYSNLGNCSFPAPPQRQPGSSSIGRLSSSSARLSSSSADVQRRSRSRSAPRRGKSLGQSSRTAGGKSPGPSSSTTSGFSKSPGRRLARQQQHLLLKTGKSPLSGSPGSKSKTDETTTDETPPPSPPPLPLTMSLDRSTTGPILSTKSKYRRISDTRIEGNSAAKAFIALVRQGTKISDEDLDDPVPPPLTNFVRSSSGPLEPSASSKAPARPSRRSFPFVASIDEHYQYENDIDSGDGSDDDNAFSTTEPWPKTTTTPNTKVEPTLQPFHGNQSKLGDTSAFTSQSTDATASATTTSSTTGTAAAPNTSTKNQEMMALTLRQGQLVLLPVAPNAPNAWKCDDCDVEINGFMKFCGHCGTPKLWSCEACQFDENPCSFLFCGMCGGAKRKMAAATAVQSSIMQGNST